MSLAFVIVLAVAGSFAFGLMLFDALRPRALRDKPPRFLDEHQVHRAQQDAAAQAYLEHFHTLLTDPYAEADQLRREHGWPARDK